MILAESKVASRPDVRATARLLYSGTPFGRGSPPSLMAEGPVVVAVAQADADAVDGVAVGEPVERQPSGSSMDPNSPAVSPAVSSQVSDGYLYSALYAKCFASFDTDKNGTIDRSELRAALNILGLESVDVDECMAGFPNAAEGIALKDWEEGLDDRLRAAIDAKFEG